MKRNNKLRNFLKQIKTENKNVMDKNSYDKSIPNIFYLIYKYLNNKKKQFKKFRK